VSTSSLLVGEYEDFPAQSFTVNASPTGDETKSVATGSYYAVDSNPTLGLNELLELQLEDHTDITTATVELLENRKIKITCDVSFTITWTASGTTLRDVLGFAGDLTPTATSFTADNISKYIWSPGKPESSDMAPIGVAGTPQWDAHFTMAPTGATSVVRHNSITVQEYWWRYVPNARVWTSAEAGGEHKPFWDNVLSLARRFKLYRNITDDTTSSASMTLGSPLGPFKMRHGGRGGLTYPYPREPGFELVDGRHPITLPCVKVAEIS